MDKNEFFTRLFENLPQYGEREKEDIKEYYEELINEGVEVGISEAEVISKLETPEKIAESLKKEQDRNSFAVVKADNNTFEKDTIIEETYNPDEYVSKHDIINLVVCSKNRRLSVEASLDDKVHIYCEKYYMDEIVCYEKEGMFYFSQNNKKSIVSLFNFRNHAESAIIVKIPRTVIQTELSTTNGNVSLENFSLPQYITVNTTNGSIDCNEVVGNKIELTTTNAKIKCRNVDTDYLYVNTTNGGIRLNNIEAANEINAETTNASVKFEKINADIIKLESSNAAISGIMPGNIVDYSISSHTSNGKNSLPRKFQSDKNGLKKLKIKTSNASIKVDFEEA